MKKGLLVGGGILIVVIAAAVYFLLSGLGGLVKTAVETAGSDVTQVKVSLDEAEVAPTEGRAALRGLVVGNPSGFETDSAFELGEISVTIDTATVTQDPVVIKEVVIAGPKVTYELSAQGSNIDAIKKNVERYAAGSGGGSSSKSEGPKVIIENLYVRGGQVNISAVPLGGKTMTSPLPEIHLKDIGKEKGGADPAEVAEKVISSLTTQVGGLVGKLDISGVLEGVTDVPESLKGLAGGAGEAAKSVTEGAGSAVKDVTEGAGGAMKKLLGN